MHNRELCRLAIRPRLTGIQTSVRVEARAGHSHFYAYGTTGVRRPEAVFRKSPHVIEGDVIS